MQVLQRFLKVALAFSAEKATQGGPAFPEEAADQKSLPAQRLGNMVSCKSPIMV